MIISYNLHIIYRTHNHIIRYWSQFVDVVPEVIARQCKTPSPNMQSQVCYWFHFPKGYEFYEIGFHFPKVYEIYEILKRLVRLFDEGLN